MTRLKSILGAAAAVALLASASPATAQQCCAQPDPCCNPCTDWCDMCGDWEIGAHALYLLPVGCPFAFAINAPLTQPAQPVHSQASALKCSGDWGFRVFGRYMTDCSFIGLSYQWFETTSAGERVGPRLFRPGQPFPTPDGNVRIRAKQSFQYQNVDVRWGKYLYRSCGCDFYLFGNARWVDLSVRQTIRSKYLENPPGQLFDITLTEKGTLQGGALGVGTGANFDLWCNFGIFGEANALGVIGERSTRDVRGQILVDNLFLDGNTISYPSDTCVISEVNFRIGLNYNWTCGCWTVLGEIGYEVDYFWDALTFQNFLDQPAERAPTTWVLKCSDVGFSGLFFGARLLF